MDIRECQQLVENLQVLLVSVVIIGFLVFAFVAGVFWGRIGYTKRRND